MKQNQYTAGENGKENKVDLILLWHVFVDNLWKIILVGVLVAGLLGSFRFFTTPQRYTASIKFLINGMTLTKIGDEYTYISSGSTTANTAGSQFAMNAPAIIGGDNTLEKVREHLIAEKGDGEYGDYYKGSSFTNGTIAGMISVSYDEQLVVVSVTHTDPQVVHDVTEAFRYMVPGQMDYFYGIENKYNSSENAGVSGTDGQYENLKSVAKALDFVPSVENIPAVGRRTTLYAVIGFLLGAVAVYLIAFLRTYFDNTVYGEDDLKNYFKLPVVGQIPDWNNVSSSSGSYNSAAYGGETKEKAPKTDKKAHKKVIATGRKDNSSERDYSGRLLNAKTPFAITEAFKSLRTNMCYTTKGEKCAVYGITSAYVQAGKSLVIANLAVSFAMMNKKVLLLDGDLRCPVQHKIFNVTNRIHGFSDVLAGICTYDDIELRDGGYKNLSILTCGKLPPNPAELLASENMKKFLERARQDYDFIFIDLPPVSEVSDAGIISELVTGFAFVVRAGYSDRRMVAMTLETMEGFSAPMTGFILNDIDIKSGNYYKNKYYSYGGKYSKYSKYSKYGRYSKYGKYGKYGRYGSYGSYGDYGAAYNEQNGSDN